MPFLFFPGLKTVRNVTLLLGFILCAPAANTTGNRSDLDLAGIAALSERAAFQQFTTEFWPEAKAKGISRQVFRKALSELSPDPKVMERNGNQAEYSTPIWEYIEKRVSATRISKGREMRTEHDRLLRSIERRYGVDRRIIVAVWGLETNYGGYKGTMSTVRSLATLAYSGRRQSYGRKQLIAALQILQNGDIPIDQMTGSWAGAMGHTQFIPTTYNHYAVDWDGNGARDIWNSVGDAAASTANYLRKSGWKTDRPWGWEVRLPTQFDLKLIGRGKRRSVAAWTRLGVRPAKGGNFGAAGVDSWVVLPSGAGGPAFLVTDNFKAILRYNNSTAYALAVGHLADRIGGAGPFVGSWPKDDPQLSRSQRKELQSLLAKAGLYRGRVSGQVGKQTKAAIVHYQKLAGLPPDGYASRKLLERLRRSR